MKIPKEAAKLYAIKLRSRVRSASPVFYFTLVVRIVGEILRIEPAFAWFSRGLATAKTCSCPITLSTLVITDS